MKIGIATKLALLLALVALVATAFTGSYISHISEQLLVNSAKSKLLASTQLLSRQIETTLHREAGRNLRILAHHPAALATLHKPNPQLDDQLATLFQLIMEANPNYYQIRLISAADHGMERVRIERSQQGTERVQGADLLEQGHFPHVSETLRLKPDETYMSAVSISQEDADTGSVDAGRPSVQLAMPVSEADGTARGVVVISVDVNGLFAKLTDNLPKPFSLFLANGQGDILLHPDSSKTFGFIRGQRILVKDEFPSTGKLVGGQVDQAVFETSMAKTNEPIAAAFVQQKIQVISPDDRFFLGLSQPLSLIHNDAHKISASIWNSIIILSLSGSVLAIFLARYLTRPLNLLNTAAHQFAHGQPHPDLPLNRQDEIGDLARSFHQMQHQITKQLIELDREIIERKQIEKSLINARSEAEAATAAKSRFLANMSHEIRTPMNGVIGMTDLLLETTLDQHQREYAETVKKSSKSLMSLINDILDISKIEAHRIELVTEPFRLHEMLADTVDLLMPVAKEKGLLLELQIDRKVPLLIKGDEGRLRQVITNLLGNAVKFTHSGSITLQVLKTAAQEHTVSLSFSIADTGIGIAADKLGQIFEPFAQGDASTTRIYGGTGLGLSISRQLVELMGGTLEVRSTEGVGSTFSFTITLEQAAPGEEPLLPPQMPLPATRSSGENAGFRILLAEDDQTNQFVLKSILARNGYQVDLAENGRDALRLLELHDYDLVLMDCMMPEMDGYETTATIRNPESLVRSHTLPIIALTANAMHDDRERCLNAGMNDYLSKPVDMAELLMLLIRWLR